MCHICAVMVPGSYQTIQAVAASSSSQVNALAEYSWNASAGQPVTLTYSFDAPRTDTTAFSTARQASAEAALESWAAVANITFNKVSGPADITFGIGDLNAEMGENVAGVAYQSTEGDRLTQVDIVIDDDVQTDYSPGLTPFQYLLHEIGHALGLKHPFEGSVQLPGVLENSDFTVMSYTSGVTSMRLNASPMIGDIAAAQYLYGARTSYASGDTQYHFDQTTSGAITLWDTGGSDMIDASGNGWNAVIDLREGVNYHSTILFNNIWIAPGVQIENAMGDIYTDTINGNSLGNRLFGNLGADTVYGHEGNDTICGGANFTDTEDSSDVVYGAAGDDIIYGNAGDDTIYGGSAINDAAETGNDILYGGLGSDILYGNGGNDTLVGAMGDDTLYGGAGDDHYVMLGNGGIDWVFFQGAGEAGGDVLKVSANINGTGIATAADVIARAVSDGSHSWIDLGAGNGVLALFTGGALSADDIVII